MSKRTNTRYKNTDNTKEKRRRQKRAKLVESTVYQQFCLDKSWSKKKQKRYNEIFRLRQKKLEIECSTSC